MQAPGTASPPGHTVYTALPAAVYTPEYDSWQDSRDGRATSGLWYRLVVSLAWEGRRQTQLARCHTPGCQYTSTPQYW